MTKIAFLLLAHKDPTRVIAQARALTAHGDCVAIHFDKRASTETFREIKTALAGTEGIAFAARVKCGWGQFSLVQATLNLISVARREFDAITHYYLISGDCYPTKSRAFFDTFLSEDADHIETHDFFTSGWIKTGLQEDRLIYRHWWNEREHKRLFYTSLDIQRRLGLSRPLPEGMKMRIGSQWWVLRASTIERIVKLLDNRPDLIRFFKTTWIPDETFFQTLVSHGVDSKQIKAVPPTHLLFSDYGMPVVFYSDHFDYLRAQQCLFARKLSPHADGLRTQLLDTFKTEHSDRPEGGAGTQLYAYLAGRGRHGQRYQRRFWERAIAPREDAQVLIVAAKIWHIGREIEQSIAAVTGIQTLGYLFDDDTDPDLALGNLEHGVAKRGRHRQALLNLIIDTGVHKQVVLLVDPSRSDVIDDIAGQVDTVRLLLVERPIGTEQIEDHARRVGLIGANSGTFERQEALQAIRTQFDEEEAHLRRAYKGRIFRNALDRTREENTLDFGHFLHLTRRDADALAREAEKLRG